jgi:aspartyl-tRNA(Asn)/glutamyl-tRNA(Gln) amidotransferase subunit B
MRSADEAKAYVSKLRTIMRYLGTCDGNMEQGSLRADINVSVRRPGAKFGTRCEIKNVNSIRFMGQAIDYEARRQIGVLEDGGSIDQETRLFDPRRGETRSMRSKEEAHDYRYFPDPDLLPLEVDDEWINRIAALLPELPDEKKARFMRDYSISSYDAGVLVAERETADYFESLMREYRGDGKVAANWLINEHFGRLNREGKNITQSSVTASANAAILRMTSAGTISGKTAKDVFDIAWRTGQNPEQIVATQGLQQVTDIGSLDKAVSEIIAANPDKVEQVRSKPNLLGWFVGQVMKATGGKASPQVVNALLREKLGLP